jgi:hypothetical protein
MAETLMSTQPKHMQAKSLALRARSLENDRVRFRSSRLAGLLYGVRGRPTGKPDYSGIPDPKDVVTTTKPTPRQVKEMKRLNREHNGGVLRDDVTGELMQDSAKSTRGLTSPQNEAQVDHVVPQSRDGTRSSSNLELRTRKNNCDKWDKLPGEK